MKTSKYFLLLSLSLTLLSTQCSSDEPIVNSDEAQQITNDLKSGEWIISYFFDSNSDETSNFLGDTFEFGSFGIITVSNASPNIITGSWSIIDGSSDDSSDDTIDLNINFVAEDFQELNDDWEIISHSSSKIELIDVSGGDGDTDYLTFTKQQ